MYNRLKEEAPVTNIDKLQKFDQKNKILLINIVKSLRKIKEYLIVILHILGY